MAIFTASQATQAVTSLAGQTQASVYSQLIADFQAMFDLIQAQSALGATQISWTLSLANYNRIQPVLAANGYTVSSWPQGITDPAQSSTIAIAWPASTPTTYPSITGLQPTTILANQNVYFVTQFVVSGGTAPYTFAITGTVPAGLSWSTLTGVTQITLSGTPTQPGNLTPGFTISVTDAHANTFSQTIAWTVTATNILTVSQQAAGTESITYNANTGVLTFVPYLLPAATTGQLGGVKIDNSTITVNGSGQIQYILPTATSAVQGAVRVDGTSIQAQAGVISLVQTTLDTRIRAISAAFSVAMS